MKDTMCKRCGGAEGESRAWHDSVVEPGDLDLIEYEGDTWHHKCAEDDRATSASAKRIRRDAAKRSWGS